MKNKTFENFPAWMICLASSLSILIYIFGAFIMVQISILALILYLAFCVWCEIRVMKISCINCYYYGRFCGFGRGKLCSLFFKPGKTKNLCKKQISWKDMIPDFLVSIIPIAAGIILLIINFRILILIFSVLLFVLMTFGNALIRGKIACKYCRQREYGCPAEKLFGKKK